MGRHSEVDLATAELERAQVGLLACLHGVHYQARGLVGLTVPALHPSAQPRHSAQAV